MPISGVKMTFNDETNNKILVKIFDSKDGVWQHSLYNSLDINLEHCMQDLDNINQTNQKIEAKKVDPNLYLFTIPQLQKNKQTYKNTLNKHLKIAKENKKQLFKLVSSLQTDFNHYFDTEIRKTWAQKALKKVSLALKGFNPNFSLKNIFRLKKRSKVIRKIQSLGTADEVFAKDVSDLDWYLRGIKKFWKEVRNY